MTDTNSKKEYDVIIVGASLAGCSAAVFLARQGCKILLIDKATFPRDKVCGDGISGPALEVLRDMGVLEKVKDENPWNIQNVVLSSPSGTILKAKVPYIAEGIDGGYVFPREKLDLILFNHVKTLPNVEIMDNTKVMDLLIENQQAIGVISRNSNNGTEPARYRGKFIIAADGAHSLIARKLGLNNTKPKHRAFAIRAYFDNVSNLEDAIEIHYDPATTPGYGWIFPTGPTSANVGVIVFNRFSETKGIEKLFETFISSNPSAVSKLKNAQMVENTFKGWPLPYGLFPGKRHKGNVILTGDAGSMIDPLTGEGMYYALKSGQYAAQAINDALANNHDTGHAGKIYEAKWKKGFKGKEFRPGYIFQTFFNVRWLLDLSIKRASKHEKKAETLAGVIGHRLPKSKLYLNF